MTSRWCTHAFYKDYDGQPTLKDGVSCDLLGRLMTNPDTYIEHVIALAKHLGLNSKDYVSAFMAIASFVDHGGDQQKAWVSYIETLGY